MNEAALTLTRPCHSRPTLRFCGSDGLSNLSFKRNICPSSVSRCGSTTVRTEKHRTPAAVAFQEPEKSERQVKRHFKIKLDTHPAGLALQDQEKSERQAKRQFKVNPDPPRRKHEQSRVKAQLPQTAGGKQTGGRTTSPLEPNGDGYSKRSSGNEDAVGSSGAGEEVVHDVATPKGLLKAVS